MPLINDKAGMREALLEMTTKMLGCVGITDSKGALIGMITDGDLRRCMSDNMFDRKAVEVMTKNPKTITADILAVEALALMNNKHITQLFVMEGNKPVGIIHLHDCLRAGVA